MRAWRAWRGKATARTYVLLGVLALLLVVLFGGPMRGLFHQRSFVHTTTVDGSKGPLPLAPVLRRTPAATPGAYGAPHTETIPVASIVRRYVQIDPPADDVKKALVLAFHGDGGDAAGFHQALPYEAASRAEAVVVYPDGLGNTWTLGRADPNPDLLFVDALVARLVAGGRVDPARVFAFGYSSGGFLANLVACRHPGLLRALASNAGGAPYDQTLAYPNGFSKCPGELPTAAIVLHGDADFAVTIDSGEFDAQYWGYVNGCDPHERETTGYPECQALRGCSSGQPVVWCAVEGLNHWVWERGVEASWSFFTTLTRGRPAAP